MQTKFLRKGIIIGITLLFVGTSIVTGVNGTVKIISHNNARNLNCDILTFYPTDDSYVSSTIPSQNTGDCTDLAIRNGGSGNNWAAQPVIKFDISSISSKTGIKSATLNIFYRDYCDNSPSGRELTLYRLKGDWNEDIITWDNMPVHHNEVTSSIYAPNSPSNWMQWSVTGDVRDFITGQTENYGWIIKDEQYWGGSGIPNMYCNSKEYGENIPYLEIETLEFKTAFIFGKITNLDATGDFTTFNAVKLRFITFSPFSFNTYTSGETITITGTKLGILTANFAFGIFNAAI